MTSDWLCKVAVIIKIDRILLKRMEVVEMDTLNDKED